MEGMYVAVWLRRAVIKEPVTVKLAPNLRQRSVPINGEG